VTPCRTVCWVLFAAAALNCWGAAAPLRIIHIGIHQIEDGPSVGDQVKFLPGETVYIFL